MSGSGSPYTLNESLLAEVGRQTVARIPWLLDSWAQALAAGREPESVNAWVEAASRGGPETRYATIDALALAYRHLTAGATPLNGDELLEVRDTVVEAVGAALTKEAASGVTDALRILALRVPPQADLPDEWLVYATSAISDERFIWSAHILLAALAAATATRSVAP